MQIDELYDLTTWVQVEIVDGLVVQSYQNLLAILTHNAQPGNPKQSFEEPKNTLIQALKKVPLNTLSTGQLEILELIGIAEHVGLSGVEELEDILFRNALDIATSVSKVNVFLNNITAGVQWASQAKSSLEKVITASEVHKLDDKVLLRIHFQKDAHLSNLTEFKGWGISWYDIGRGIAMANGASPEDLTVEGASKGSIIITLATTYGIAHTTSEIILKALKVVEKVYDIKKKAQEVRQLQLENDQIQISLEDEAKKVKDSGVETITNETVKELGIDNKNDGDKVNALNKSISLLVDFIDKGGEVDFVIPDEADLPEGDAEDKNKSTREKLRVVFSEVRKIDKKLQQIEHKKDE